jgi:valyl-tRNA synthetase
MIEKFKKPYDPTETEPRTYEAWEKSGYFSPENLPEALTSGNGKPFTMVLPPPNANGSLHVGHALGKALADAMTRAKRMQGYKALWIPGADHAGFETQVVYEKKLEKEGRSRFQMDPKDLYNEILAFTLENKSMMENQVRALGASCDWTREKFTLDPAVVREVQQTFIKMHGDGLVYRGKRTVNWCPKHQTSLSDVETESVPEQTPFYTFKYGPFEIGTVRPETKFGDKYVVMHPDDARYAQYAHGDTLELEWINGPITATIIKDEAVDMEFGTGAMTITPWHSQIDFEIAKRHNLDMEQIIDWRGKLLPIAGEFAGMKISEAREKIAQKLADKGLLVSTDTEYKNVVKRCYKCNTMIEPQIKDQWFVKMAPLAKMALDAVDRKEVRFVPEHEEKVFRYWMENAMDWNISRQIVWGIPIPAWIKDDEIQVGFESPGEGWTEDTDTFDTWFSSGQWPLLTTGYPDGKDFAEHYPTDVMETGRDLVFKWIPRMVIFGLYLGKKVPFHTVYLHGMVNDANGKKMSKSKGNVINPLDLTSKYGTDALRMALVVGNTPGMDLALREDKVKGYKHFANKLWNIARFVLENTDGADLSAPYTDSDAQLRARLDDVLADITRDIAEHRLYMAAEKLYHYAWHEFADVIIEESKPLLAGSDAAATASRKRLLVSLLTDTITALHPFMPFVTEEIYQSLPTKTTDLLMVAPWPVKAA